VLKLTTDTLDHHAPQIDHAGCLRVETIWTKRLAALGVDVDLLLACIEDHSTDGEDGEDGEIAWNEVVHDYNAAMGERGEGRTA